MSTSSGCLTGEGTPLEVTNRTQAYVQIQLLPKSDVQGTNAAADRSGQRSFNRDDVFANRRQRIVRQPFAVTC